MKNKKFKLLLISAILGSLYAAYMTFSFANKVFIRYTQNSIDAGIEATFIMTPMFLILLAVLFNWIAYLNIRKSFVLTGLILYFVSAFTSIGYLIFIIPSLVLSCIVLKILSNNKQDIYIKNI